MAASLSDNSQLVYRKAFSAFNQFRVAYKLPNTWSSLVAHLKLFITYCFEMGYASSTITTYLAGLSFYHKLHYPEDPSASFVVTELLGGCRRIRRHHDVRAPITESILRKICLIFPDVCFSRYEACLFKGAYLSAYVGLMRVSEILYTLRIPAYSDPSLCCFVAIKQCLHIRPPGSPYLFIHQNGFPLTRSQFRGVLTKSVRTLGLPTQIYTFLSA